MKETINKAQRSRPYSDLEQRLIDDYAAGKVRRDNQEDKWREWNYAYQMITDGYLTSKTGAGSSPFGLLDDYNDDPLSNIHLPVEFSEIMRKLSDYMKNIPKYRWISLSERDDAQELGKLFSKVFDWCWSEAKGDYELFKTILSMLIYGDGFIWAYHERRKGTTHVPYVDEKTKKVEFKKEDRHISRLKLENIDVRDFVYDPAALNIEEADWCFIDKYYTEEKAEEIFEEYKVDWSLLKTTNTKDSHQYKNVNESKDGQLAEYYHCKYYYNQTKDEFIITIDDYVIEESHIPSSPDDGEKRIPVAVFQDHHLLGEVYGMGESEIVKPHRVIKNNLTNIVFDASRQDVYGTLVVDPYASFDPEDFRRGQEYIQCEPNMVSQLQSNANLGWVNDFYQTNDNQQVVSTGVNHMDTSNSSGAETATKTLLRTESQKSVVELGMKFNESTGFQRLGLIIKDLIRLHFPSYPINKRRIRIEGERFVKKDGKIASETTKDYTHFNVEPDELKDDLDLVIEMGNIAVTKALETQLQTEGIQLMLQLPPEIGKDGQPKPVVSSSGIAKWAQERYILPEDVLAEGIENNEGDYDALANEGFIGNQQPDVQDFSQEEGGNIARVPSGPTNEGAAGAMGGLPSTSTPQPVMSGAGKYEGR